MAGNGEIHESSASSPHQMPHQINPDVLDPSLEPGELYLGLNNAGMNHENALKDGTMTTDGATAKGYVLGGNVDLVKMPGLRCTFDKWHGTPVGGAGAAPEQDSAEGGEDDIGKGNAGAENGGAGAKNGELGAGTGEHGLGDGE